MAGDKCQSRGLRGGWNGRLYGQNRCKFPLPTIRPGPHLRLGRLSAIIQTMAVVRVLAALLLIALTANVTAQIVSAGHLVVTVVDPSGAAVPEASIMIFPWPNSISNDDWLRYALLRSEFKASTDASGTATLDLERGSYAVTIRALGFAQLTKKIETLDASSQTFRATLTVARSGCGVCVQAAPNPLPTEHYPAIFIPLERLQTMNLPAVRYRRR